MSGTASDNTKEAPKTQADSTGRKVEPGPSHKRWTDDLGSKFERVGDELDYKERQILSVLDQDIPDSYYRRWQGEANALFALAVRLRLRHSRYHRGQRLINRKSSGYMGF